MTTISSFRGIGRLRPRQRASGSTTEKGVPGMSRSNLEVKSSTKSWTKLIRRCHGPRVGKCARLLLFHPVIWAPVKAMERGWEQIHSCELAKCMGRQTTRHCLRTFKSQMWSLLNSLSDTCCLWTSDSHRQTRDFPQGHSQRLIFHNTTMESFKLFLQLSMECALDASGLLNF